MAKRPEKRLARLGTYGERVGRERAARRRAARERAEQGREPRDSADDAEPALNPADPEIIEIIEIPQSDLANELSVLAALIMSGLARSHPEARRHFREDGISVNDTPIHSDKAKLRISDVSSDGVIKLSIGQARHVLLRPA